MKRAELFQNIFGIYATELWSFDEEEFLKWINEDAPVFYLLNASAHAHKVRAHSQGGGTHWVVCSNCEKPIDWQDAYCKHCGAIMDEEVGS